MSISSNPSDLYYARDVRELDRIAIEEYGIPAYTLMQRAGKAAFNELLKRWPGVTQILIFCGAGNNGGDGYVIASLAAQAGISCRLWYLGDPDRLSESAARARKAALDQQIPMTAFRHEDPPVIGLTDNTVLVDALLGTGLQNEVRGGYRQAIDLLNQSGLPVLAVDIPSGLNSDTGQLMGVAVKAELTVSFIALKIGQSLAEGPRCCGDLILAGLDVPREIYSRVLAAGKLA